MYISTHHPCGPQWLSTYWLRPREKRLVHLVHGGEIARLNQEDVDLIDEF